MADTIAEPAPWHIVLVYRCKRCHQCFDVAWATYELDPYELQELMVDLGQSVHECQGGKGLGVSDLIAMERRYADAQQPA